MDVVQQLCQHLGMPALGAFNAHQGLAQRVRHLARPGVGGHEVKAAVVLALELLQEHAQLVAVGGGAVHLHLGEPEVEITRDAG